MFKSLVLAAAMALMAIPAHAQTCTRDALKGFVANYFKAIETHDMAALPTAPTLRITENGVETKAGEGLVKTGGKATILRSLIDTERCGTVTQALVDETVNGATKPAITAVRLKVVAGKVTEIEALMARDGGTVAAAPPGGGAGRPGGAPPAGAPAGGGPGAPGAGGPGRAGGGPGRAGGGGAGGFNFYDPAALLATKDHDWEVPLPAGSRPTRAYMNEHANRYFSSFADNPKEEANYATPCHRWEGGLQTTLRNPSCSPKGLGLILNHTHRRFPVTDTETGATAGFMLFGGGLPDVHMFKFDKDGKIYLIQAVFGGRVGPDTQIWPDEK